MNVILVNPSGVDSVMNFIIKTKKDFLVFVLGRPQLEP